MNKFEERKRKEMKESYEAYTDLKEAKERIGNEKRQGNEENGKGKRRG